jgi:hypothetical protein
METPHARTPASAAARPASKRPARASVDGPIGPRENGVPKIKPAPATQRHAYRKTLAPDRRPVFDELAGLIDQPRLKLDWYHRVGQLTNKLCPFDEKGYYGSRWIIALVEALGPSSGVFYKAAQFATLYPKKKELQLLKNHGVEWSRLKLSFSIKDPSNRLALLTKALKDEWTIGRFHFEVQQRHPSIRRGLGGRRPGPLGEMQPEAALQELLKVSRAWLHIQREVWEKPGKPFQKQIKQLVRTRNDAKKVLGELKEACEKVSW